MKTHPSDSKVQLEIEKEMLGELEKQHPDWQRILWKELTSGRELARKVKPDAVWKDGQGEIIIAECYVRIDPLKPGQCKKLAMDTLKLISLRKEFTNMTHLVC